MERGVSFIKFTVMWRNQAVLGNQVEPSHFWGIF